MKYLIVCPGHSLNTEEIDYGIERVDRWISCNGSYILASGNICYSSDPAWYREAWDSISKLPFKEYLCPFDTGIEAVQRVDSSQERLRGTKNDRSLYLGHSTGYAAIDLALLRGAKEIYLLGYDMGKNNNNEAHYFGDYPESIRKESPYDKFILDFKDYDKTLELFGSSIINCTIDSNLKAFPIKNITEVL